MDYDYLNNLKNDLNYQFSYDTSNFLINKEMKTLNKTVKLLSLCYQKSKELGKKYNKTLVYLLNNNIPDCAIIFSYTLVMFDNISKYIKNIYYNFILTN